MYRRAKKNRRSGAVVVEIALTLPLLFFILLGALELSHANMVVNVAEAAAFEGAREGIVPGATTQYVTEAAKRLLNISKIRGATIAVTPSSLSTRSENIYVRIDVPYDQNTLIPPFFTRGMIICRYCKLTRESAT